MTPYELEDIKKVALLPFDWNQIDNSTIMISGGTGFIGTFLSNVFRYRNENCNAHIKVISLSRRGRESDSTVTYSKSDITQPIQYDGHVDYIIHLASNTHPKQYAEDPVGTIITNVIGCDNLLRFAVVKNVKRFVFASSVEIYGQGTEKPMAEDYSGYIDCNNARSGYNEAKRTCEALCRSYQQQLGVDPVIVRFARAFGADKKVDTKAMSQFMDKAVNGENIVLKSKGGQRYSYVYIADAVSGLLKVLLDGKSGEAYNISDEDEGKTLGDYAQLIAGFAGKQVVYEIEDNSSVSKATYALLDIDKAKQIGWKPLYRVSEALERTYRIKRNDKNFAQIS